ncbi:MAG: J domain-containing protein [Polyangiales bacterium]
MGLFDRFAGKGPRTVDLRDLRFGRSQKTLAELSDEELEEELLRRRRARAQGRAEVGPVARTADKDNPERKQLLQWYANLELPPFASLDEVRKAYRDLMKRYHPDRHATDPERQRIATELAQSLTRAYESLTAYLEKR